MSGRKVAMLQPNYIPWKGVFDLIHRVDVFVFYDDVQYTRKDWRNRNIIPTKNGDLWLSVPVITKGKRDQKICDVEINKAEKWQDKHYRTLTTTYAKAPFFDKYKPLLDDFYKDHEWDMLSDMDIYMTKRIADILGIDVEYVKASDYGIEGDKNGEKVLKLCKELGCDYFLNGPASREFMDEELFKNEGVVLDYMTYDYPEYRQLVTPFNHHVSVIDLLFNTGDDAPKYIWG